MFYGVQSKSISSVALYKKRPTILHLNVVPFIVLYLYLFYLFIITPAPIRPIVEDISSDLNITSNNDSTTTSSGGNVVDAQSNNVNIVDNNNNNTNINSTANGMTSGMTLDGSDFYLFLLGVTACLHILSWLFKYWSVEYRTVVSMTKVSNISDASMIKVVPSSHVGSKTICPLIRDDQRQLYFEFQKRKFTYDPDRKCFKRIKLIVPNTTEQLLQSRGYDTQELLTNAVQQFGLNRFDIPLPSFLHLYKEQALAPFFVFQVFCVLLWCLEEYVLYCLFTLFMLLTFEATVVKSRLRNLMSLREMSSKPSYPIYVYRLNQWKQVDTSEIIPGDLVSVGRGANEAQSTIPCDLLLLSGQCVVNEAMLTGESTPHHKESLQERSQSSSKDNQIDLKNDKIHILFGGTQIVQHSCGERLNAKVSKPTDRGCIGYALKTGFDTNQGSLMRTIWFSSERVTANNKESFLFIAFLLVFAIAASAYLFWRGFEDDDRNKYKLLLHCIMVITSVVPPELPMELSLAVNNSLIALVRLGIYCTEPFRIPFAGKVDVCCFDKTGTLTTDDLILQGIASCPQQSESGSSSSPSSSNSSDLLLPADIPLVINYILAGCHSLVSIDGKLVGDPMETASLKSIPWNCKGDISSHQRKKVFIEIVNRYLFSSDLKRMSTIANVNNDGNIVSYAFCKGAPEVLKPFYSSIPADYDNIYKRYSRQGSRVLALGYKKISTENQSTMKQIQRDVTECDLEFGGFLVFDCPLKPDSKDAIEKLAQASHSIVMITGDNALTACHVAKQLGIQDPKLPTLNLTANGGEGGVPTWISVDETVNIKLEQNNGAHLRELSRLYNLSVTGQSLSLITDNQKLQSDLYLVQVFARVSPDQKQLILTNFKENGHHTLMAGDGTNDVGALKQAHVGVAILNKGDPPPPKLIDTNPRQIMKQYQQRGPQAAAELTKKLQEELKDSEVQMVKLGDASIAAPFTSKSSRVIPVTHIIRQGRCTLVTTHQMYKILALNSLISAYSLSVLHLDGVKLGDTQVTLAGMLIALCFLFISTSKPLERLAPKRPNPNLFSPYMMTSILLQFILHLGCLIFIVREANDRTVGAKPKVDSTFEPNLVNSAVFLISNAMQVATFAINYKGHPFMQSLQENRPLLYCLSSVWMLGAILSLEIIPSWNEYLELIPFPDNTFRLLMFGTILIDLVGAWLIEKLCSTFLKN
ncbi:putative cation-transporting ATPase [Heterostelium album PN500]|uniref:Putative cation-transporting ATPase n=1 Tax=Heterostelium pallidum (strain ATCC 26659 / Pp 5 / PN500) TaxID=670386 RepID=D3BEG0_HETP5|nr:putative cation-transporting ATPase [Heterostelium album PN500]EFA80291.1 putative cation-transporting ATPase [Heterostelium album PN500]|eukprot:XP_020432411.1 putative cation-transporting ATPase [Heterostelium album PN500]